MQSFTKVFLNGLHSRFEKGPFTEQSMLHLNKIVVPLLEILNDELNITLVRGITENLISIEPIENSIPCLVVITKFYSLPDVCLFVEKAPDVNAQRIALTIFSFPRSEELPQPLGCTLYPNAQKIILSRNKLISHERISLLTNQASDGAKVKAVFTQLWT